ncbi:MAG: ComF family protein [candidate division Zixibacteria bacterium]|nr:ComF family protein [candidate division Zixibacteria bacterium]
MPAGSIQSSKAGAGQNSPRFILDALANLVFPFHCPICEAITDLRERPWCDACGRRVGLWTKSFCPQCRRFRSENWRPCPGEHDELQPVRVRALGAYDDAFGPVVRGLKYDGLQALAAPLGCLLAERLRGCVADFHAVVSVPTVPRKRRERGFGHAELIATHLADALNLPYLVEAMRLLRRVDDQTRLSPTERQRNVEGAFGVGDPAEIRGWNILLVDDVMTTGATLGEASRALVAAGATNVAAAVVALNVGETDDTR